MQLRRDHPCATAFLDETGAISQDRFFAVGLLKSRDTPVLLRSIQKLRDREHWYGEIKFTDLTSGALPFYRRVVDLCLAPGLTEFFCFVADRQVADPVARFGSPWHAYGKLAEQLVTASLHPGELLSLMARASS